MQVRGRWIVAMTALALGATAQECPWTATESGALASSQAGTSTEYGYSLAISGDTLVVGAHQTPTGGLTNAGAAFVHVRTSSGWVEQDVLKMAKPAAYAYHGRSVAIDGDTIVVGVYADDPGGTQNAGSAFVYRRSGNSWATEQKLVPFSNEAYQHFGWSVAIDGDTVVVGAPGKTFSGTKPGGAAFVFVRSGSTWVEQATLVAADVKKGDGFGIAVGVSGDTVAVGAPGDSLPPVVDAGSVRVFTRGGTTWTERATLTASDMDSVDRLGASVAIDGGTILAGVPNDEKDGILQAGGVRVFVGGGASWSEEAALYSSMPTTLGYFGHSVALDGDLALAGAHGESGPQVRAGAAYLFARNGTSWTEKQRLLSSSPLKDDGLGWTVAISGARAAAGAHLADGALTDEGAVHAFDLAGTPVNYCTAGVSASGCQATITATGAASATSPSGFVLTATGVEGAKAGHFYFAANGRRASTWGNGTSYQCVEPPVKRGGPQPISGTVGACDGTFAEDLNARWTARPNQNPGPGTMGQAQLWYRDPQNTSNQTTSLSNAVEYCVGP